MKLVKQVRDMQITIVAGRLAVKGTG